MGLLLGPSSDRHPTWIGRDWKRSQANRIKYNNECSDNMVIIILFRRFIQTITLMLHNCLTMSYPLGYKPIVLKR